MSTTIIPTTLDSTPAPVIGIQPPPAFLDEVTTPHAVADFILNAATHGAVRDYVNRFGVMPEDLTDPEYRGSYLLLVSRAQDTYAKTSDWPLAYRLDRIMRTVADWVAAGADVA